MRFIICASGIVTQPLLCFASLHRSRFLSYVDWVLVVRGGGAYANVAMRPLPTFEKFHDTRPGALTRVSTVRVLRVYVHYSAVSHQLRK